MTKPARLLIADSEIELAESLVRHFAVRCGYPTGVTYDGPQTVEFIREHHPDLVLLDIDLPGLNGAELVGEIARVSPQIKVVIVTFCHETEMKAAILRNLQVVAYLHKPGDFSLRTLERTVEEALGSPP